MAMTGGGTREKALAKEADEQRCQEEAACAAASAEITLAKEGHCHKMAQLAAMLAEMVLTAERRRSLLAARAAESALATAQVAVLADLRLPKPVLAKDKWRQEETTKNIAVQMTSALWRWYCHPTLVTRQSSAFG
jgi:hypothetical protein